MIWADKKLEHKKKRKFFSKKTEFLKNSERRNQRALKLLKSAAHKSTAYKAQSKPLRNLHKYCMIFWSHFWVPNFPNVRFLPSNVYFLGHFRPPPPLKSAIIYVRSVVPNIKCKYKCSFTNLVPEMEYALKGKDMREHC